MSNTSFELSLQSWFTSLSEGKNPFPEASSENKEQTYALAYALYEKKKYRDASYFFRGLVTVDPKNVTYWKGLAASLQMQNDSEGALNCYLALLCLSNEQSKDPMIYIHTADCYFALQRKEQGLKALACAEKWVDKKHPLVQHIEFMRNLWKESI